MQLRKDQKELVDGRLWLWARAVSGGPGVVGTLGNASMMAGEPNEFGTRDLWSPEVEEVEQAVRGLGDPERDVIKEHYLRMDATVAQSCRHLGISSSEYYRRRDTAIALIYLRFESNKKRVVNF
tara:strand:- start:325 stop:696 length:372 start_codon:yes stop_codon:yes gene_type:complete